MYFVDAGRPLPDPPPLLKTRRHLHLKQARELWSKAAGLEASRYPVAPVQNPSAAIVA